MPPCSTTSQPRGPAGIDSAMSAYTIGSMPPAATPMRKHMNRLAQNAGMVPQMAVPMNSSDASRMAARRPMRSAMTPQKTDPSVVPASAHTTSHADLDAGMPYSAL